MRRFSVSGGQESPFHSPWHRLQAYFLSRIPPRTANALLVVFLYLLGIAHWLRSFWFANLTGLDWRLTLAYQSILKQALQDGRMPYLSTFNHYTDRYLGTPESPLSPQFLMLPWIDGWAFNVLNLCLLYSLSFAGLLLIKRRYGLSWIPFTALCLLFNFNGYIVARVAAGHTMWYGYFFLPFFYLCLFDILGKEGDRRAVYLLAGTLFLMELQGSFHLLVWCFMFLGLVAVFNPRRLAPIAAAVAWAVALCAFRLVPAAVTLHGTELKLVPYFPTLGMLLEGLTLPSRPTWVLQLYSEFWHEMDCYVGVVGLAMLVGFGCAYPYRHAGNRSAAHRGLYPAMFVMTALSVSSVWRYIFDLGLPFVNSQRVPSRFIVLPLTACIVLAAQYMQRCLEDAETRKRVKWLLAAALVPIAFGLNTHSTIWTVREIEVVAWDSVLSYLPISLLDPDMSRQSMRLYVHAFWASSAFSLAAALCWGFLTCRAHFARVRVPASQAGLAGSEEARPLSAQESHVE